MGNILRYIITAEWFNQFVSAILNYFVEKFNGSSKLQKSELTEKELKKIEDEMKKKNLHLPAPFQFSFKELNEDIFNFGCYYLSILFLVSVLKEAESDNLDKVFDLNEVNLLLTGLAKNKGIQEFNCYVKNPNLILKDLGVGEKIFFTDQIEPASFKPKENQFLIGQFKNNNFFHFVFLDNSKKVIWDSLLNSSAVANGTLNSVRVFEVRDKELAKKVRERILIYKEKFEAIKKVA